MEELPPPPKFYFDLSRFETVTEIKLHKLNKKENLHNVLIINNLRKDREFRVDLVLDLLCEIPNLNIDYHSLNFRAFVANQIGVFDGDVEAVVKDILYKIGYKSENVISGDI